MDILIISLIKYIIFMVRNQFFCERCFKKKLIKNVIETQHIS
ncbi:hypothetical protein RIEPE_0560 [Candidatus Riesia pediculicola USDA]|uniref:Uncharacterized protein n=1 Tax=Riesia pediculicola (strain USDA) TaxID=515618 RepID=D4G8Y4_RIEPU|nr:hypothetical protein RIEPE_0560 [Candidatus Riesia pediculicola USDA]